MSTIKENRETASFVEIELREEFKVETREDQGSNIWTEIWWWQEGATPEAGGGHSKGRRLPGKHVVTWQRWLNLFLEISRTKLTSFNE